MIIKANSEERLDKYLANNTDYSRNIISKMIDQGIVLVNNKIEN